MPNAKYQIPKCWHAGFFTWKGNYHKSHDSKESERERERESWSLFWFAPGTLVGDQFNGSTVPTKLLNSCCRRFVACTIWQKPAARSWNSWNILVHCAQTWWLYLIFIAQKQRSKNVFLFILLGIVPPFGTLHMQFSRPLFALKSKIVSTIFPTQKCCLHNWRNWTDATPAIAKLSAGSAHFHCSTSKLTAGKRESDGSTPARYQFNTSSMFRQKSKLILEIFRFRLGSTSRINCNVEPAKVRSLVQTQQHLNFNIYFNLFCYSICFYKRFYIIFYYY